MVDRFHELELPLTYLEELTDIGHYPHTEAPEAVAEGYLAFIGQIA